MSAELPAQQSFPVLQSPDVVPAVNPAAMEAMYEEPLQIANEIDARYTTAEEAIGVSIDDVEANKAALAGLIRALQGDYAALDAKSDELRQLRAGLHELRTAEGGVNDITGRLEANLDRGRSLLATHGQTLEAQRAATAEFMPAFREQSRLRDEYANTAAQVEQAQAALAALNAQIIPGQATQDQRLNWQNLQDAFPILTRMRSGLETQITTLQRDVINPNQIILNRCADTIAEIDKQLKLLERAAHRDGIELRKRSRELKPVGKSLRELETAWRGIVGQAASRRMQPRTATTPEAVQQLNGTEQQALLADPRARAALPAQQEAAIPTFNTLSA